MCECRRPLPPQLTSARASGRRRRRQHTPSRPTWFLCASRQCTARRYQCNVYYPRISSAALVQPSWVVPAPASPSLKSSTRCVSHGTRLSKHLRLTQLAVQSSLIHPTGLISTPSRLVGALQSLSSPAHRPTTHQARARATRHRLTPKTPPYPFFLFLRTQGAHRVSTTDKLSLYVGLRSLVSAGTDSALSLRLLRS